MKPIPLHAPRLPFWLVAAALLLAFGLVGRIDLEVELAEAEGRGTLPPSAFRLSPSSKVAYDLRACTPRGIPVSPLVEFTVIHHPDGPYVAGCTRYAAANTIPTHTVVNARGATP